MQVGGLERDLRSRVELDVRRWEGGEKSDECPCRNKGKREKKSGTPWEGRDTNGDGINLGGVGHRSNGRVREGPENEDGTEGCQ